jgi:hypothetical protein
MDPITTLKLGQERLEAIRDDARRRHDRWHATHDECMPPTLRRRIGRTLVSIGHAVSGERGHSVTEP